MRKIRAFREVNRLFSMLFLHIPDVFTGEESRFRLLLLKTYCRYEIPLPKAFWAIIHSPLVRFDVTRKALYYTVGKYLADHGIVGRFMTADEMTEFINGLPEESAIALGPCRCRLAVGGRAGCEHPLQTEIVIATGVPVFLALFPEDFKVISREEAIEVVRNGFQQGLAPSVYRHMYYEGNRNYFIICNCCGDACMQVLAYRTFKADGFKFISSPSVAEIDPELCRGCGICVEACAFGERVLEGGTSLTLDCQGCGQCARQCPHDAISMVRRG